MLATIKNWLAPKQRDATQRDPEWFFSRGFGRRTSSGVAVTKETALMLPAVWQAIAMISQDIAKLPLNLYRKKDDDDREIFDSHVGQRLVRWEANREMTAKQFWRQMMGDALIYNNAYAFIARREDGRPDELIPLLPDRTGPERLRNTGQLVYVSDIGGQLQPINPYDVIHIRGMMMTCPDGSAPKFLNYAKEAIGLGLAAQDFESKFFKNGLRASGILQIPPAMTKGAADNLEKDFRKLYESPDGWYRAVVLKDGAQFHSISQNNKDSQAHELRQDQVREVARLFNLPPSRLGLSDSVSYNSKAEDNQAYHDTTLAPWLDAIADECWFKLLLPGERRGLQYYFEHNTASLLRLDLLKRFQAYEIAVNPNRGGFMLESEVRKKENLPSIAGIDDRRQSAQPSPQPEDVELNDDDDESSSERSYGPNEARDRWLCEEKSTHTYAQLAHKLDTKSKSENWTPLGKRGVESAIKRYKSFFGEPHTDASVR